MSQSVPRKCGYSFRHFTQSPSIFSNVKKIRFQNDLEGQSITTVKVENFFEQSVELPSKYNPPKMRTILTGTSAICNLQFGDKTVQFIAVDGNGLSEYQFSDPDTVINLVNNKRLKPIQFNNLDRLNSDQMTQLDAYSGSIWYCLFLYEIFGRVGIIDDDMVYLSVVNVNMANAFWNSHYMTYGNGRENGKEYMGPLTSIDVIGHESGHGIVEALGGLEYRGESGALNESIADIFGTCLEKYYDIKANKNLFDWDLGEDFIPDALRSLSNPKKHQQPDLYQGTYWANVYSSEDQGGVHTNSGVGNFLYYIVATGSEGTNEKGGYYKISKPFQMFKFAELIYKSLGGFNNFQKIGKYSTYKQYAGCLKSNCKVFLEENKLSEDLLDSIDQGLIGVGLKEPVQEPNPEPNPWPEPQPDPQPHPEPSPWPEPQPWPQPNPWPHWPLPSWPQWPIPQWPIPSWPNWLTNVSVKKVGLLSKLNGVVKYSVAKYFGRQKLLTNY